MLKSRFEHKFLVSYDKLDALRDRLMPFVDVDEHKDNETPGVYPVRSLYYETPHFKFYNDKLAGIEVRKKIRIRGYNGSTGHKKIFLEIKRKYGGAQYKNRSPLYFDNLKELLLSGDIEKYILGSEGLSGVHENAQRFLYHVKFGAMKPVVLVIYRREAYFSRFDRTMRVTIDSNLRSCGYPAIDMLYSEEKAVHSMSGKFILEVKTDAIVPTWMKRILRDLRLKKQAISKYVICVDANKLAEGHQSTNFFSFTKQLHD